MSKDASSLSESSLFSAQFNDNITLIGIVVDDSVAASSVRPVVGSAHSESGIRAGSRHTKLLLESVLIVTGARACLGGVAASKLATGNTQL